MESVIKFLNENTDYNFHSQLDISIKTCVSDPQNSVFKSYRVLEQLIEELYFGYGLNKSTEDIFTLINGLSKEVSEYVINDMHNIRKIRNKAAHTMDNCYVGTAGSEIDFSEAIYVLKKIYDLLAWFVNLDQNPKLLFLPFQELLDDILDKSIEKKVIKNNDSNQITIDMKIGDFIQTKVMDMLERQEFSDDFIEQLTLNEYSFSTFSLKHPFLSNSRAGKIKTRYYSKPVKIKGKRYYINNAWNDNNKPMLLLWYEKNLNR